MKRLIIPTLLMLAACNNTPLPETRESALSKGQNAYYIITTNYNGERRATGVFIDPRTGCEYWQEDSQPRNDSNGQQVCIPIDATPRLVQGTR
jgi:hypothetical protein